jgi:hypothetical protein
MYSNSYNYDKCMARPQGWTYSHSVTYKERMARPKGWTCAALNVPKVI